MRGGQARGRIERRPAPDLRNTLGVGFARRLRYAGRCGVAGQGL